MSFCCQDTFIHIHLHLHLHTCVQVLLLHTMTKKLGFTFSTYRLIPNGSFSRVGRLDDLNTTHEVRRYVYVNILSSRDIDAYV